MEIIIEYEQMSSSDVYSNQLIQKPNFISIGHDVEKDSYYLIYNKIQYLITSQEIEELFQTLENIELTKLPRLGIGIDGETYMLKISNGWNSVSFEWWSDSCGDQWKGLMLFRDKITGLKEKYIVN